MEFLSAIRFVLHLVKQIVYTVDRYKWQSVKLSAYFNAVSKGGRFI
jgi:hypothetical protein